MKVLRKDLKGLMDFNGISKILLKMFILVLLFLEINSCSIEPRMKPLHFKSQSGITKKLRIQEDSLTVDIYGDYRGVLNKRAVLFVIISTASKKEFPVDLARFKVIKPIDISPKINMFFEDGITVVNISIPFSDTSLERNIKLEIEGVFQSDYLLDFDIPRK